MAKAETIAELRGLSDEKLIERHDACAKNVGVETKHYLQELYRRDQDRVAEKMLAHTWSITAMTRWITAMTFVVTLATIANLVVTIWFGR